MMLFVQYLNICKTMESLIKQAKPHHFHITPNMFGCKRGAGTAENISTLMTLTDDKDSIMISKTSRKPLSKRIENLYLPIGT